MKILFDYDNKNGDVKFCSMVKYRLIVKSLFSEGVTALKHALVIGGTGMLAKVTVWLAENGYHVSIVGRNPKKMQTVLDQKPSQLTPVLVDYTDTAGWNEQIRGIQQQHGPIQLIVAWVHSTAPQAIPSLLKLLPTAQQVNFFHVNGSSSNLKDIKTNISVPDHVRYHQVQLGFKIENGSSRWLTNDEIADGVIHAIREEQDEMLIGSIEPWDLRP